MRVQGPHSTTSPNPCLSSSPPLGCHLLRSWPRTGGRVHLPRGPWALPAQHSASATSRNHYGTPTAQSLWPSLTRPWVRMYFVPENSLRIRCLKRFLQFLSPFLGFSLISSLGVSLSLSTGPIWTRHLRE